MDFVVTVCDETIITPAPLQEGVIAVWIPQRTATKGAPRLTRCKDMEVGEVSLNSRQDPITSRDARVKELVVSRYVNDRTVSVKETLDRVFEEVLVR